MRRNSNTRDRLHKARYNSMRKYCNVKHIPFDIDYYTFVKAVELPCIFCKKKDNYLNYVYLKDPLLGVVNNNVLSSCYVCTRNRSPGFH